MAYLKEFIKDPNIMRKLSSLDLGDNSLKDNGVIELSNGLAERFHN